jgi:response regulator RpfG family c-di-GMP phosphodiesterase
MAATSLERLDSTHMTSRVLPEQAAQDRVKILLVDDSPENLVSLEATLDGLGQELVLAKSGTEALRHGSVASLARR